jgi:hypothetical protein
MAAEALLREGFQVSLPLVDTGYDLLAIKGASLWRIQVKATSSQGRNKSRVRARRGAGNKMTYTDDQCDAIVAVHTTRRAIACMTLQQLKGRSWINFADCSCANIFSALQ